MASPASSSAQSLETGQKRRKKADDRPKRQRIAIACVACRQRKAKCDGQRPCGSCTQAKLAECIYPATVKKVDPDYLEQLERRIEELSGQFARHQGETQTKLGSNSSAASAFSSALTSRHSLKGVHASGSGEVRLRVAIPDDQLEDEPTESHESLLTLIASPGVNTHFPDSSTRTLFDEVEGATRRLVGSSGDLPPLRRPRNARVSAARAQQDEGAGQHIFSHSRSQQDLYALPHRGMSDTLVKIYKERVHPIFRILHWPTFVTKYENTFKSGEAVDKHWLGLLNQVYAIACQIGGPGVPVAEGTEAGLRFYQRSLALMFPLVLQSSSIQALQCVLLMVQYLQSISQPNLCWNTVGHAVRFAQSQGLYSQSTLSKMDPIEAETRRRVWAGVVAMEATTAATLGLPPSLTAGHCQSVEPTAVDDELITSEKIFPQPLDQPSVASFIQQTYKLFTIQLRILCRLYKPNNTEEMNWPSSHDILDYDRQLENWDKQVPEHLRHTPAGVAIRGENDELVYQTNVLRARFLNAKILAHRPMLFHLVHEAQPTADNGSAPSTFDLSLAYVSARICCSAAVSLLELVTSSWKNSQSGAWWYQLYYVYSASLVILASFLVDTISDEKAIPCVVDLSKATAALRSAHLYLSENPEDSDGLMPHLVNQSAKDSVRSCHAMLTGLMKALAGKTSSPLHVNSAKGDYHSAIRMGLGLPLSSEADASSVEPASGGEPIKEDPFEDFWTLLSQTRPPSPQPLQQFMNGPDSILTSAHSQAPWQAQLPLGPWPWSDADLSLTVPQPLHDSAFLGAYASQNQGMQNPMNPAFNFDGTGNFAFFSHSDTNNNADAYSASSLFPDA